MVQESDLRSKVVPSLAECYRILGVSPRVEMAEIKRRFRLLALKFHPDRNPGNDKAAFKFRQIATAYQTICQHRDKVAAIKPPPESKPCPPPDLNAATSFRRTVLSEFFGFEAEVETATTPGPDFRYDLQIPFAAAIWGSTQTIEFQRLVRCPACQGSGMQTGTGYQDCPSCGGSGRRWRTSGELKIGPLCATCQGDGKLVAHPCDHCQGQGYQTHWCRYSITIPPGVEDGTRLFIGGAGGESFQDGPPGHLVVVIHVAPDETFTRRGQDLYCTVRISKETAVWGGNIEIPTLVGSCNLHLPGGIRSGQRLVLSGLGVPANGRIAAGDLIVTFRVDGFSPSQESTSGEQQADYQAASPELEPRYESG